MTDPTSIGRLKKATSDNAAAREIERDHGRKPATDYGWGDEDDAELADYEARLGEEAARDEAHSLFPRRKI